MKHIFAVCILAGCTVAPIHDYSEDVCIGEPTLAVPPEPVIDACTDEAQSTTEQVPGRPPALQSEPDGTKPVTEHEVVPVQVISL